MNKSNSYGTERLTLSRCPLNYHIMTLYDIQTAVEAGKIVHWNTDDYTVIKDSKGQWLIQNSNGHCIGLTWTDGETMNGYPEEFYIDGEEDEDEPAPAPVQWVESYMQLDDLHLPVKGMYDPENRWNGWANPYFTLDACKLLEAYLWKDQPEMIDTENGYYMNVVLDVVNEWEMDNGERVNNGIIKPIIINGVNYYGVGGFNLCWSALCEQPADLINRDANLPKIIEAIHERVLANDSGIAVFSEKAGYDKTEFWQVGVSGSNCLYDAEAIYWDEDEAEAAMIYIRENQFSDLIQVNP